MKANGAMSHATHDGAAHARSAAVATADVMLATVGNLGWDEVRFPKPVFAGDTIHGETRVLEKRESKSRPTNGIVVFEHRGLNQRDELICSCKRSGRSR